MKDYQQTITDLALMGEDWTEEAIAAVMRDQENEQDKLRGRNEQLNHARRQLQLKMQMGLPSPSPMKSPDMMRSPEKLEEPGQNEGQGHVESRVRDRILATSENMTFCTFLYFYFWHLWAGSTVYSIAYFIFFGQILLLETPAKLLGYNKMQKWQPVIDEQFGYIWTWVLLVMVPLIPGLYFNVLSIDATGHRTAMWVGFVLTAVFLAACAGSTNLLLNPNESNNLFQGMNTSYNNYYKSGWLFMFGLTYFFMNWGPLPSIFVITAELFPTRWRCTGYGLVHAAATFWAFIGVFAFLYAVQPMQYHTTFAYPCDNTGTGTGTGTGNNKLTSVPIPSDFFPYGKKACLRLNDCPHGRTVSAGDALGSSCLNCISGTQSGCYPFGIGLEGAMSIMIPILLFGAAVTQLLPVTTKMSLEGVSYQNEDDDETSALMRNDNNNGDGNGIGDGNADRNIPDAGATANASAAGSVNNMNDVANNALMGGSGNIQMMQKPAESQIYV
jgi:Sugar (and other) transporter